MNLNSTFIKGETNMLHLRNLLCAVLLLTLSGCAPFTITTNYDTEANFASLKTFDWMPNARITVNDPRVIDHVVESNIRSAVISALAEKGYTMDTSGNPDFYVAYHASLQEKTDTVTYNRYYGYTGRYEYWGPQMEETYTYTYDEGTLILDFIDAKTKQPIWRGSAKADVRFNNSPEQKRNKVNQAVTEMLKTFPPK
ncbi:MAG: DUF4136 domain-containing protein [Candidatus Auribacter fodinae]|jgi:hypothetical protein|uniref:DUF4136 domain-containing protein n=1 Tax=Candidatus Auribacter fodinae TaxID=2093366 RepID=A0A3A4R3H0_9BACT|nr:MAG: DUF4136 domain-containing protein [Candidatus Auribacter fodinae]